MRSSCGSLRVGLLLSGAGLLGGCADNESMLFVRGAMHLTAGSCDLVADSSATMLTNGVYDIAFKQAYSAALLVGNQLASRGQKARSRTETSSITLEGAEVNLLSSQGGSLVPAFTSPGAGFVEVGSGQDNGYGVMSAVIIPAFAAKAAATNNGGYVIAEIKVFGKTLGGQDVESGVFKFPITVCSGCLVQFPVDSVDAVGNCIVGTTNTAATQPCVVGQDDPVNCAVCAGNFSVCAKKP